jgi:uncharacterized protein (DUF1800 family)
MKTDLDITLPISLSTNPYNGPWTKEQAAHLLRRSLFGVTYQQIADAVQMGMEDTVQALLTPVALTPPVTVSPDDGVANIGDTWVNSPYPTNTLASENARRESLGAWISYRINQSTFSVHEKMCLFWQNHFSAEAVFDSRASYQYLELISNFALGNIKTFTKEMTINPAMLLFLSGAFNNKFSPNENFARELFEIFTLGKGPQIGPGDYTHYTENDILEASKVLTGWMIHGFLSETEPTPYSEFHPALHDETDKTFSHHFNNQIITNHGITEYELLIDMLFDKHQTAVNLCTQIYRWFVNYDITPIVQTTVIEELAQTMEQNNFEIAPVLDQLFKSEHFYDIAIRGAIIKNPYEFMFGIFNCTNSQLNYNEVDSYPLYLLGYFLNANMGMDYGNPPTVGGWTAYYQAPAFSQLWVNSSFIKLRFDFSDWVTLWGGMQINGFTWEVNHIEFLNGLSLPASADDVIDDMITIFCPKGLDFIKRLTLKNILTNGLPDFEWTIQYNEYLANPNDPVYVEPVKLRIALTLTTLFKMPECQTI